MKEAVESSDSILTRRMNRNDEWIKFLSAAEKSRTDINEIEE